LYRTYPACGDVDAGGDGSGGLGDGGGAYGGKTSSQQPVQSHAADAGSRFKLWEHV